MGAGNRKYIPALEGIRGYAYLLVFAVHFSATNWDTDRHTPAAAPWLLFCQLSFIAVPIFFALSGYLITGILVDTRDRQGYFRIFYARRALRVFPLYYLTLLIAGVVAAASGAHLHKRDLLFFTYLYNLRSGVSIYQISPLLYMGHLWSLAVEEQFYFLWPLVIFFLRSRRSLLTFCYSSVALISATRLLAPSMHLDPAMLYQNTFFRADSIMLGAALAVHQRSPGFRYERLLRPAMATLIGGALLLLLRGIITGQALPFDPFGIRFITPVHTLMGTAAVVVALNPGNWMARACERPWAVHLGQRSYALYVFHQLFGPLFLERLIPRAARHIGSIPAHALGMCAAFALVYVLGALAYRSIEQPCMDLKKHFRYGEARTLRSQPEPGTEVAAPVSVPLLQHLL